MLHNIFLISYTFKQYFLCRHRHRFPDCGRCGRPKVSHFNTGTEKNIRLNIGLMTVINFTTTYLINSKIYNVIKFYIKKGFLY